ncbi:MAG: hypothetical protein SFX73_41160 [Kofleriaceae bacterium]|nr:hypothetical protein [Kofleriaceae bacterium]
MRATHLLSSVVLAAVMLFAGPAAAEKPNPVFAGRIMMSDKRFPMSAKSLAAFNAQVNKQSKTSFYEDKDQKWKIFFIGFLKAPLPDLEYMIKIYDLSGKGKQLLSTFEQFTDERNQTSLISNVILERKQFGVNKELLITMEYNGKVLASGKVKIAGKAEKFTGKVNFSDDEAANGSSE